MHGFQCKELPKHICHLPSPTRVQPLPQLWAHTRRLLKKPSTQRSSSTSQSLERSNYQRAEERGAKVARAKLGSIDRFPYPKRRSGHSANPQATLLGPTRKITTCHSTGTVGAKCGKRISHLLIGPHRRKDGVATYVAAGGGQCNEVDKLEAADPETNLEDDAVWGQ